MPARLWQLLRSPACIGAPASVVPGLGLSPQSCLLTFCWFHFRGMLEAMAEGGP